MLKCVDTTQDTTQEPAMPNGVGVVDYSNYICENLGKFIEDVLLIVPEVKKELNTTWEKAKKEL